MKKIIIFILVFITLAFSYKNSQSNIKIPDSAIRFRVLANSNSPRDQKIKEEVRDRIQEELYDILSKSTSIEDAREKINNDMLNLNNIMKEEMENKEYSYDIDYGMHYFPEKVYKGVKYDEGYYESLLITLGKGEGNNWWCVLFPPLCVLEAEETNTNEIKYKSFVKELIEKYF